MIRQVDPLISLPATDVARGIAFYTEVLGLELQYRTDDGNFCIFRTPEGETLLGLHRHPGPLPAPDPAGTWLWLKVDDLEPVATRLAERGARLLGAPESLGPGHQQLFLDSEGNLVRLYAPIREVRREVRIDASPETVFAALTEPRQVEAWFAVIDDVTLEPRLGGRIAFIDPLFGQVRGRVSAWDPGARLAFEFSENWPTSLEFTLTAVEEGTLVRVVQRGFDAISDRDFGIPGLVSRLEAGLELLSGTAARQSGGRSVGLAAGPSA